VAPLVAACGGTVAKMSGRGLGHTGGTLDKLESIPGTSIEQSMDRFKEIVKENGVAVIGQTGNLVPADKKLYALRDVTATVRSIPLIASSIMSKKLASGADAIVLDVKTGTGAFMRTKEEAFTLAKLMVSIGTLVGRKVRALVTDMNQPLGMAVGNALEVREAVELLSGKIAETDPLYEVCMLLGENMMMLAGLAENEAEAQKKLKQAIADGSGLKRLQKMIALQGGDSSYLTVENMEKLVAVKQHIEVKADSDGYVSSMNAEKIGTAAQLLGAGRAKKEDTIDPAVGLVMRVRCGYAVKKGSSLCTLYVNDDTYLKDAEELLHEAIEITPEKGEIKPMIYGTVTEKDI
jgi:pyrimidine-nucleoside phosphorylase